jgi:hypothetical protein
MEQYHIQRRLYSARVGWNPAAGAPEQSTARRLEMAFRDVKEVVAGVVNPQDTPRQQAIALHDFVREQIKFGFNKYFDATPPEYLLAYGYGHCNSKSRLMTTLLRAIGLPAYQHFVVIPKEILRGAIPPSRYWMIPAQVSHSFVEVQLEQRWLELDSYVIDTPYLQGAQMRLLREGSSLGYGVRTDSTNLWDGQSNAFAQFDRQHMLEDHGRIGDLEAFFKERRYRGVVLGLRFNTLFQMMGEAGVAPMNAHLEQIRQMR